MNSGAEKSFSRRTGDVNAFSCTSGWGGDRGFHQGCPGSSLKVCTFGLDQITVIDREVAWGGERNRNLRVPPCPSNSVMAEAGSSLWGSSWTVRGTGLSDELLVST